MESEVKAFCFMCATYYHTGCDMRILVDYRPALRARTGVGEYIHTLVGAYTAVHDDEVTLFTSSWKDRPSPSTGRELRARIVDRRVPVSVLNYLWHRLEWPPAEMLAGNADVVHAAHPLIIPARRAAQVVTIHDLFFLASPERTRAEIRRDYAELAPAHARRADAVITSTAHTKALLIERLGVASDRICVCPPGAPTWQTLGRAPNVPRDGYVLFLGTLEPRKNLDVLLDAYALLARTSRPAPRLVIAGGATPDAQLWIDRITSQPLRERVLYKGYVAHDEREALYAGARALVLPSLDEGFGLPVLEAMSAGVPVVTSNRGSLPEVSGAAGVLLDPHDAPAWAATLERLAGDTPWATDLACAGLERARAFTWDKAAAQLRQGYLDAVRRRGER
jgi:glycosyltransferase involved in cell wall biosynthesis